MARYQSRGKLWNVGLSDPGRLPATSSQLWALHLLSRRKEDFRGKGHTRDEASAMIRKLSSELEEEKRGLEGGTMHDAMFDAMMRKAVRAASAAGDHWLAEHPDPVFSLFEPSSGQHLPVFGAIGHAYIAWPQKKSPFAQWLKRHNLGGQTVFVPVPHAHVGRLELDLQIACEAAALRVLEAQSVTGLKLMVREDPSIRSAA